MTPNNGSNEPSPVGSTAWDFAREVVRAIRDIFNAPAVAITFLIVVLLIAGKVAAPELGAMGADLLRAWRCQP